MHSHFSPSHLFPTPVHVVPHLPTCPVLRHCSNQVGRWGKTQLSTWPNFCPCLDELFGCFKRAAYSIVRVTHILLFTGVFQGHDCRSNGSILGARGTFKFFLKKIFDLVIRSNMAAIFFSARPGGQCGGGQEMGQLHWHTVIWVDDVR